MEDARKREETRGGVSPFKATDKKPKDLVFEPF